jgi:hypothetical protein
MDTPSLSTCERVTREAAAMRRAQVSLHAPFIPRPIRELKGTRAAQGSKIEGCIAALHLRYAGLDGHAPARRRHPAAGRPRHGRSRGDRGSLLQPKHVGYALKVPVLLLAALSMQTTSLTWDPELGSEVTRHTLQLPPGGTSSAATPRC